MARNATGSNRSASNKHRSASDIAASTASVVDHEEEEEDDPNSDPILNPALVASPADTAGECVDTVSKTLTSSW